MKERALALTVLWDYSQGKWGMAMVVGLECLTVSSKNGLLKRENIERGVGVGKLPGGAKFVFVTFP